MLKYAYRLLLGTIMSICFISVQGFVLQNAHADQKPPATIDQIMAHLAFDKRHKKAFLDGKILSTGMPEMEHQREEIAVAAVMLLVKAPMEKVVAAYLDGESFRQDDQIIEYKIIPETGKSIAVEEVFKPIGFTENESSEVNKFLDFKGGLAFNFSPDEIERIQSVDSKDYTVRDKASLILRHILVERYQSYLIRGLESVKSYERGTGKRSLPGNELSVAIGSIKMLENYFPDFHRALLHYPEGAGNGIKNEFYWFKNKMDNRPAYRLSHFMSDIRNHYAIVAELQFYVEHTYNSMLTIIGCMPYESGTVVFCANRTFADQVMGAGSRLKRSIGRRRIEEAISDHFANLRRILESKAN